MKQLTCEMCGSTDMIKQDGFFVCQACGTKYSVEEAKKMMIEGTVEVTGTVKVDDSAKLNSLFALARREIQMNDYVKAKEYYEQILLKDPNDWEASFFSILGKAYGITRGQVPSAVIEIVNNIPIAVKLAVDSTNDAPIRRDRLDIIVTHTVQTYVYLKSNLVSSNVEEIRNFGRLVVACMSNLGYQIQDLGVEGKLGDSSDYNKLVAKAFRWRTEYALSAPAMFDEATRSKYVDELSNVDPTYTKPSIGKSPGCYVATCIYGSYDCPQVWTLRRYRDDTLGATWHGRLFIRTYYAISPTLVRWFGHTTWFKKLWKGKLDRMVEKLQANGVENTPYQDKEWNS